MPIKKLTLLRHAKAVPAVPGADDHGRALNGRGRRAAAQVGIETAGARPDVVLCSDSARTRETWEILSQSWATLPPVLLEPALYMAKPEALLDRLRHLAPEIGHAWLIGHNPGLHDLARHLAEGHTGAAGVAGRFPTAARARFELEAASWAELGMAPVRRVDFFVPIKA
jgi:phosphohistidine phosphatase